MFKAMEITFKEVDHKYWISNLEIESKLKKVAITTDFKNLYLQERDRSKIREYRILIFDNNENIIETKIFKSLNKAKKYGKNFYNIGY
jgi:hypothetical protein